MYVGDTGSFIGKKRKRVFTSLNRMDQSNGLESRVSSLDESIALGQKSSSKSQPSFFAVLGTVNFATLHEAFHVHTPKEKTGEAVFDCCAPCFCSGTETYPDTSFRGGFVARALCILIVLIHDRRQSKDQKISFWSLGVVAFTCLFVACWLVF